MTTDNSNPLPPPPEIDSSGGPASPPTWAKTDGHAESDEWAELDHFDRLDIRLRQHTGYIALGFAVAFWVGAIFLAFIAMDRVSSPDLPSDGRWHVVVALIVALFSVPSLVMLTIFTGTKKKKADSTPAGDAPHNQLLKTVNNWFGGQGEP